MNTHITTGIETELDLLAELKAARDVLPLKMQELINSVLTPEQLGMIQDIREEFRLKLVGVDEQIEALQNQITEDVLAKGASVKGVQMQAVFNSGRVSWNSKLLEGYLMAHPEIAQARSVGKPYVTFRSM